MSAAAAGQLGELMHAGLLFRVARWWVLLLIFVLPIEAITAVREVALVGGAVFLAAHLWLEGPRRFRATVLIWPLLAYAACAAFSLLSAMDVAYSLKELRAEVLKGAIAFYLGVHYVQEEEHLAQAWAALVTAAGIMGLMGVVLFIQAGGDLLHHYVRAGSLHSGYGSFGTYLVLVWPFLVLAPRAWPRSRLKPLIWLALALTAASAYLTFARATWLAMLLELGLVLTLLSRRRLAVALGGTALCVILVGALLVLVPGARHGERWQQLWKDPAKVGGTTGDLVTLLRHSAGYLEEHPFTGIGLGRHSFSKAFPEFRLTHQPLLWHAHNMFLGAALQMGLQGLAALLWIMVTLVVVLWPHAPPGAGDRPALFMTATAVMVVGFAVRNLADNFFVDDTGQMFWLLSGLALGARWWQRQAAQNGQGARS